MVLYGGQHDTSWVPSKENMQHAIPDLHQQYKCFCLRNWQQKYLFNIILYCQKSNFEWFLVLDICTSLVTSYSDVKAANSGVPKLLCLALFHSLWTMLNQKIVKNIINLWLIKIDFRETIIFQTIFSKLRPWCLLLKLPGCYFQ